MVSEEIVPLGEFILIALESHLFFYLNVTQW